MILYAMLIVLGRLYMLTTFIFVTTIDKVETIVNNRGRLFL